MPIWDGTYKGIERFFRDVADTNLRDLTPKVTLETLTLVVLKANAKRLYRDSGNTGDALADLFRVGTVGLECETGSFHLKARELDLRFLQREGGFVALDGGYDLSNAGLEALNRVSRMGVYKGNVVCSPKGVIASTRVLGEFELREDLNINEGSNWGGNPSLDSTGHRLRGIPTRADNLARVVSLLTKKAMGFRDGPTSFKLVVQLGELGLSIEGLGDHYVDGDCIFDERRIPTSGVATKVLQRFQQENDSLTVEGYLESTFQSEDMMDVRYIQTVTQQLFI